MGIGVIGLGNIGGHIASNLVADQHEVTVYDVVAARREALVKEGAAAAASPAEVARATEVTFTSLPTPRIMEQVAREWLGGAPPGSILVDLSTNAPDVVRRVGALLHEAGRHFLEAPLTGGAPGAKARALVFMVGGERAAFERIEGLLKRLGRATFYVGELGKANTAKLVNSLLAFTSTWVSIEGLALAARAGIDLRTMVEIVRTGGAGNFYINGMVEGINQRGGPVNFALELAAKDARLIAELAERSAVPAPVAQSVARVFESAVEAGLGKLDWSGIVELIERQADLKLWLEPKRS